MSSEEQFRAWTLTTYARWSQERARRDAIMESIVEMREREAEMERWMAFANGWCRAQERAVTIAENSEVARALWLDWVEAIIRACALERAQSDLRARIMAAHDSLVRSLSDAEDEPL